MSNQDFDFTAVPDPANIISMSQRAAVGNVATSLDDDPDKAARALDIAGATGQPSSVVYGDLDHHEAQLKSRLSSAIVADNPLLQTYVNSHPMAAKVSNDDYGQLDATSQVLTKHLEGYFASALQGFKEGAGSGQIGDWNDTDYTDPKVVAEHPAAAAWAATITGVTDPLEAGMRLLSGLTMAGAHAVAYGVKQATGSEAAGEDVKASAQAFMDPGFWASLGPIGEMAGLPFEIAAHNAELRSAAEAVGPYALQGKTPPVGVHPLIDEVHAEQAKTDADNLGEALKQSVKSATRERSPEMFANFIRGITDGEIGIKADAVRELYGDKPPVDGEGPLGFVLGLDEKLRAAEATGGDVQVPLADWLAKVEPDVAKELGDHIRARPEGLTVEEGKNLPPIEAYHGSPYEFDAFSRDKIGTGEGAQSYGHGLYFAEAPEVAQEYQSKLGLAQLNLHDAPTIDRLIKAGKSDEEIVKALADRGNPYGEMELSAYKNQSKGATYKVHIHANKEDFLDWDKALGEQPAAFEKLKSRFAISSDETGESLVRSLRDELGDEEASKALAEAGIPGIKYLDQGSRDHATIAADLESAKKESESATGLRKGEIDRQIQILEQMAAKKPTSNFVLFDPSLVEITHRNGEAVRSLRQAAGLEPALAQVAEDGKPTTKAKQLELPAAGTTRIEDREAFAKAAAIGMTKDQYSRYQALIEQRTAEDTKAAESRAMADQRKRQTVEWKANRAELRPQVAEGLRARPDVQLDEMLREGKIRIARDALTPEQIAGLPPSYVAKNGIHPDDLAGLFGDSDGRITVGRLVGLHAARGDTRPGEFIRKMIDAETDRQMEARYGSLDRNILDEAKDQVLSETQEQLLHEETMARASEAGLEYSIGKEQLKASIKGFFDRQLVREVSSDKALAEAGRAGRETEMALLKGDPAEAFRQKQRQYNAVVMANFARKFEKEQARFERLATRYEARALPAVEQEYTNWIHDLLMRTGNKVKRSVQDLAETVAREPQKTLADFVAYKERHDLREVPVADFLQDPAYRKTTDNMTTVEAQELHNAVRALDKNGRDEKKYIRQGDEIDLGELKGKLVDSLQRFKQKEYDTEGARAQSFAGLRHVIRSAVVAHLQVETVFNRLDRFDPTGPWNQYIFRPMVEGANLEARLEREFSKKLGDIADNVNLKDVIPDSPFMNPDNQALPMRMTRKNLRAVMLNFGNNSNFTKLAAGYLKQLEPDIEPGANRLADFKAQIQDWVHTHATKEDWDWSQKVWDMLAELGDRSSTMYRALTGLAPEKLPIEPIQTPHGTYAGGYYPLIRHPTYGTDIKLAKNDLEGQGYVRATTAAGYTKQRTGAIYPLSMDLDGLPNVMRQIIHDTAMRPAIVEVGKIFYDNKINNELRKHLGQEYADMFVPWLKDVANTQNYSASKLSAEFTKFSDFMRQNAITTLVGFNPSTVLKHTPTAIASSLAEVGPMNLLRGVRSLMSVNEETGNSNLSFMRQNSEEMQRRMRNWVETMGGGMQRLEGRTALKAMQQGDYGSAALNLRDIVTQIASSPVALGDFMSSAPTWMGKYAAEMEDHGVHGDAVFAADKAVRQAHGSSAITSRSAVARSKSLSWFTGFFTFFNDLLNRQIETLWRAGEAVDLAKEGRYDDAMDQARSVGGRFLAYVVAPAMIEELVSPLPVGGQDNWTKTAAKSLAFTMSSSWVFVREIVNAMLNARDPSVGLISTMYKSITDVHRDLTAVRPNPGNIVKHGTMLTGMLTGLTPAQIGRSAEFALSKERPKGPWGWLVGARYGTLKNHSQTFDQYLKGR